MPNAAARQRQNQRTTDAERRQGTAVCRNVTTATKQELAFLSKPPNARAKGRAAEMPAKHDDASRRVPLSAWFDGRRQRPTEVIQSAGNQACFLEPPRPFQSRLEVKLRQHTPPKRPLQPCSGSGTTCIRTPTRLRRSAQPDARRQRDYRCRLHLTPMERRGSAPPAGAALAYHSASLTGPRRVRVPPTFNTAYACGFRNR
jgi:hypothetical protein